MSSFYSKPDLRFNNAKVAPSDCFSKADLSVKSKNNNSSFDRDDNSYVGGLSGRTSRNKVVPMFII